MNRSIIRVKNRKKDREISEIQPKKHRFSRDIRGKMGTFFRKLALFSSIFLIGYAGLSSSPPTPAATRRAFSAGRAISSSANPLPAEIQCCDLDILFAGSSHCYRSFDPRFYRDHGLKTFNMGSTSQSPINTYYLLEKHIDTLSPKLIVLEVYWGVLELKGVESLLDLSVNLPVDRMLWRMAWATRDIRALNRLLAVELDLDRKPLAEVEPEAEPGDEYVPGGFVNNSGGREGDRCYPPTTVRVNSLQIKYLERIIELADMRGIGIVLVAQPVPQATLGNVRNYGEIDSLLNDVAARYGVPYLDFNAIMDLNDSAHFYDYHHLNSVGVAAFNRRLLDELANHDLVRTGG